MSELSSVTEVILVACIVRTSPHFGHDAICIAGNGSEFTLATTFTRVPHLQRHIDTFATIRASSASCTCAAGFYACENAEANRNK
jgi:hypothetical protein